MKKTGTYVNKSDFKKTAGQSGSIPQCTKIIYRQSPIFFIAN